MSKDKVIVNSWNEWDPLKHVIVGRADGCCIPAPEPALDAKVPEDSDMKGSHGPRTKDTVDKANELLNNFASMLEKRGIKVDRPVPLNHNQKISTPDWEVESMFGCMPARDIILTVGNEMQIELILKNEKILDFGYQGKSCVYCQASASLLSKISINNQKEKINDLCDKAELYFNDDVKISDKKCISLKKLINKKNINKKDCILLPFKTLKKIVSS